MLQTGFQWDCDNWHVTRIIKKYIYKIARMSQGSIKKGELWEGNFSTRRLSVNHSGISDKYSQNQHNTI